MKGHSSADKVQDLKSVSSFGSRPVYLVCPSYSNPGMTYTSLRPDNEICQPF